MMMKIIETGTESWSHIIQLSNVIYNYACRQQLPSRELLSIPIFNGSGFSKFDGLEEFQNLDYRWFELRMNEISSTGWKRSGSV